MVKTRIGYGIIAVIIGVPLSVATLFGGGITAYAETPVGNADGTYSVTVNNDMTMGGSSISSSGTIEKSGDNYYASISFDTSSLSNVSLNSDGMQVGCTSSTSGSWITYTYTLSSANLARSLPFSARVNAMARDVAFNLTLDLNNATRTSDTIADIGERPAEFVPVIATEAAGEYEAAQGGTIVIPSATAVMGTADCAVAATAYYLSDGARTSVDLSEVENGYGITLSNVGEYHLVYTATSSAYKTSFGNDTFAVYDIKITSSIGGGNLAKFTDAKGVLQDGVGIVASRITDGSGTYTLAAEKMAAIADNFEVFGVNFINSDGTAAVLSDSVTLYLQADATFDRNQVTVYHMATNGDLTKLSADGYGRYVMFDTTQTGTFIVCVPGVAFVMPMWGYLIIVITIALIFATAITVTIILVRRKRKADKA